MLTAALVGAVVGLVTAARTPGRYRSEALILVVPQRVPDSYVRSTVTTPMRARLQSIGQRILARTRMEQLIQQFNLYREERRHGPMEEVIERMRKNVDIAPQSDDSFRVGFTGTEAQAVIKVTERLATLFIQESAEERAALAEQAHAFLEDELAELRTRLTRHKQQLNAARHTGSPQAETMAIESEVLEATFKDLVTKLGDSQLAINLERRQIGEQFTLLDPARVAERPFSPDRRVYAGVGAVGGLASGLLLSLVVWWTRSRGRHRQQPAVPVEA